MRVRRESGIVLVACFVGALWACSSYSDATPAEGAPDAGPDASSSSSSSSSSSTSSGGSSSSSSSSSSSASSTGGYDPAAALSAEVAVSASATCSTVIYSQPTTQFATYCWGGEGTLYPEALRGGQKGDPGVDGFYRPRVVSPEVHYLSLLGMKGAGSGDWFLGGNLADDELPSRTYTWGINDDGQCGAGNLAATGPQLLLLGGKDTSFENAFVAPKHGCIVSVGRFGCWGSNENCELRSGAQATCNDDAPVLTDKIARTPEDEAKRPAGDAYDIVQIAGGRDHTCTQVQPSAGIPENEIRCWGSNVFGQAGAASDTFIAAPTSIGIPVAAENTGMAAGDNHTCAITNKKTIVCWGRNDSGQSNPANPSARSAPTPISVPTTELTLVRAAGDMSCVVSRDGADETTHAYCWGSGPKARATSEQKSAVGKIAGIKDIVSLAIGKNHACAVAKADDNSALNLPRLWCWGRNEFRRVNPRAELNVDIPLPTAIVFPPRPAQ